MSRPIYITTPIYYVNDRPHIGHAYTTIAVDMITRYHRLAGRECFFLTGTDEHGSKVAEAAAQAGLSEIEFCNRTVETFKMAWKNLSIEYDYFIRTTSQRHVKAVNKLLEAMRQAKADDGRDVIYGGFYEGLYCTGCEKFLTEKELVDGRCPYHDRPPENLREKNYFFRLTAFLPKIKKKIESNELVILPEERRREVLGLIDQELPDFSLSRETVKWGIPLSFDTSQSAYVWVDALSNYISGIGYGDDLASFNKWWKEGEVVHLMAKDILKFHCLYWPAMLMAADVKLPDTIFLHGFFTVDGEKMSKSRGNMIDPNDMVAKYGVDATRYLLLTQYPFGTDGDIKAKLFATQYNADLANDLGNLVSRVTKLIEMNFDNAIPEPYDRIEGLQQLMEQAESLAGTAYDSVTRFELHRSIAEAMNLVKATNKFFNDQAPWVLAKQGKKRELGGVLYACCEVLRIVSIMLYPIMPDKMQELRSGFGLNESTLTLDNARIFFELKPGTIIRYKDALFPRIDAGKVAPDAKSVPSKQKSSVGTLLDISEFGKLDLRVATVLEAQQVRGANKLLKLRIDLGNETRQIVAGIAEYYKPEELAGLKIIVVINLKPAVIRGVESNGMLLAAQSGKDLVLLTTDKDIQPGAKVS